jgi:hypothetical protein
MLLGTGREVTSERFTEDYKSVLYCRQPGKADNAIALAWLHRQEKQSPSDNNTALLVWFKQLVSQCEQMHGDAKIS